MMFGDVRHVADQPYNVGNGSALSSPTPRGAASLAYLNQYSSKIQNYALADDPYVCGGDYLDAHFAYLDLFAETAAQWVMANANLATTGSAPSSTSSSTSAIAIASATPAPTTVAAPTPVASTNGTSWTPAPMPISYSGASLVSQSGMAVLVSLAAALVAAPLLL
jgi:hypothetical protein